MRPTTSALLVLLFLVPAFAPLAGAAVITSAPNLPEDRAGSSAVWMGTHALIFGGIGAGGWRNDILRYDPATGTTQRMAATLPGSLYPAATLVGSVVVVVRDRDIFHYDPATDTLTTSPARLAASDTGIVAVSDGRYAYILGAYATGMVLRYDPTTQVLEGTAMDIPRGWRAGAAVWTGSEIIFFAGWWQCNGPDSQPCPDIVRIDPATQTVRVAGATTGRGTYHASAVWDGRYAWLIGGTNGAASDRLLRYDPVQDVIVTASQRLPAARWDATAVWTGTHALVIGGRLSSTTTASVLKLDLAAPPTNRWMSAEIPGGLAQVASVEVDGALLLFGKPLPNGSTHVLRYEPSTDTLHVMRATLPKPLVGASAVWTGRYAYVFGGLSPNGLDWTIFRYDPVADEMQLMSATLPSPRFGTGAAWDGDTAYIVGGWGYSPQGSSFLQEIVRYDPDLDIAVAETHNTLEYPYAPAVAYANGRVHIFGGMECSYSVTIIYPALPWTRTDCTETTRILEYDPLLSGLRIRGDLPTARSGLVAAPTSRGILVTGGTGEAGAVFLYAPASRTLTQMSVGLEAARGHSALLWNGTHALLLGGEDVFTGIPYGDILRYIFTPGAPQNVRATAGPSQGQVTVEWQPPVDAGSSAVLGYRVRGFGAATGTNDVAATARSLVIAGLPHSTSVEFEVQALNEAGAGAKSVRVQATTLHGPPTVPTAPQAIAGPEQGTVTLQWQPPANWGGATPVGYRVYRAGALHAETTATTLKVTGLADGATVSLEVSAVSQSGEGPRTAPVVGRAPYTPTAPRDLVASASSTGEWPPFARTGAVSLSWSAPEQDGAATPTYRVYRATQSGESLVGTTTTRSFSESGLPFATDLSYRVTAGNAAGEGPSVSAAVRTPNGPPSLPRAFAAETGEARGTILVSWQPPEHDGGSAITSYFVTRIPSLGSSAIIYTGSGLSVVDTGQGDGATNRYTIYAVNAEGHRSPYSHEIVATTLPSPSGPPTVFRADPELATARVHLTWGPPPAHAGTLPPDGYRIHRSTDGGAETLVADLPAVGAFTDTDVPREGTHRYRIVAWNDAGESGSAFALAALRVRADATEHATFDASAEGFALLVDQPRSNVRWDAANKRIAITSDAKDPGDEPFARPLTAPLSTSSFNASSRFGYTQAGSGQTAFGLYLGRESGDIYGGPSTASIRWSSGGGWNMRYTDASGVLRFDAFAWDAGFSERRLHIDLDGNTRTLSMRVTDVSGAPILSRSYLLESAPGDGFEFTHIGVAAMGHSNFQNTPMQAWVDDVRLVYDTGSPLTPPSPPYALTATPGPRFREMTLAWTPPQHDGGASVQQYRVYRAPVGGAEALVGQTTETTWIDSAADTGSYAYRVTAVNAQGESGSTQQVVAAAAPRPAAPALVAASGPARGQISLSWTPPQSTLGHPIIGTRIFRVESGGALTHIADLPPAARTWNETGLADGTTRTYRVQLLFDLGEGHTTDASSRAPIKPTAPRNVAAQSEIGGRIRVTWHAPVDTGGVALLGYDVYESYNGGSPRWVARAVGPAYTANDRPLGTYSYHVAAVNVVGASPQTSSSSVIGSYVI